MKKHSRGYDCRNLIFTIHVSNKSEVEMAIELDGKSYETDEEGYLIDLSQWNDQLANEMAKADGAALDEN